MLRPFLVAAAVLSVPLTASAQDTLDSLTQDMLKQLSKTVDVLATIKDKTTAAEATPRLRDIAKNMVELKQKAEKLKPSKQEQEALEKKYKTQVDTIIRKMLAEVVRLQKVEGAAEALKELDKVK